MHYSDFSRDVGISVGLLAGIYIVTPLTLSLTIGDALNSTQTADLIFDLGSLPISWPPTSRSSPRLRTSVCCVHPPQYRGKETDGAGPGVRHAVDLSKLLPMNELQPLNGTLMNADVLGRVKSDWAARATQNTLPQYPVRFANITAAPFVASQAYSFSGNPANTTNRPKLTLTYLADN
ncbi:hypothetical protein [Deinococcus alpinitundrae]|uniref:hypothetical protein n=1 Tax=Deinococcus alpinitundrae TaxID=468913 RepID=UPI0013798386|nr:hypothetical protein [Deinococcus alpinitundrae]